jgi:hypothetical protein
MLAATTIPVYAARKSSEIGYNIMEWTLTKVGFCLAGTTLLGIPAALAFYPMAVWGVITLPTATTLVVNNSVFGCGYGLVLAFTLVHAP